MAEMTTDVLIVGAGIAGAATAYHLARESKLRLLLLEKEETPDQHSTGRNASFIRERMENPLLQQLASESAAVLRKGELAEFLQCGLMLLGSGEVELRQRIPRGGGRGLWFPNDGVVDVAGLLQRYLAGQTVQYNTEVKGWRKESGKLHVETSRGGIGCTRLVNATGPWAGRFGDLPLTPCRRHIFVTPPMEWVRPDWPFVWDAKGAYYFRPESGGLLLCPCDETPSEPGDYTEDPAMLEDIAEKIMTHQPDLGELSIQSSWVGQRTFAPDRIFVIGSDPREPLVFHVAGLGGHGVTASFAVGRLAAQLILDPAGEKDNPFSPARLLK